MDRIYIGRKTQLRVFTALALFISLQAVGHDSNLHLPKDADVAFGAESHHAEMDDKVLQAVMRSNEPVNSPADLLNGPVLSAALDNDLDPKMYGQWSDVFEWDVVAIHATLLPTGKVLVWDATPDDFDQNQATNSTTRTRVRLWNPVSGQVERNNNEEADLFCAGSSHLWDGRVLFTGGDGSPEGDNSGILNSTIFNPYTEEWSSTEHMNAPRWYAGIASLPNGEMLTVGGTNVVNHVKPLDVVYSEVFQHDQTWRPLNNVLPPYMNSTTGEYQWMQTKPNGDVAVVGPHSDIYNIETQGDGDFLWSPEKRDNTYRGYGSYAMYGDGKVLISGGGLPFSDSDLGAALKSSVIVNLDNDEVEPAADMNFPRRQHNLTILADGSVLASGGIRGNNYLVDGDPENHIMAAEVWKDGKWTVLSEMQVSRQYHSVAILLPDGSVLNAGGGYCGECASDRENYTNKYDYEIFYPPYLFDPVTGEKLTADTRPNIIASPSFATYNKKIDVLFNGNANDVQQIHFIKLGAVTHAQNQGQRLVKTTFTGEGNSLQIDTPHNRNIAPPGHYMIFVVDNQGRPSEGQMIQIGEPLLSSGNRIKDVILQENRWNYYAIEPEGENSIHLALSNLSTNVEVFVSEAGYPNEGSASFVVSDGEESMTFPILGDAPVFIGVKGEQGAQYSLVASIANGSGEESYPVPDSGVSYQLEGEHGVGVYWGLHYDNEQVQSYQVVVNDELMSTITANLSGYYRLRFSDFPDRSTHTIQIIGLSGLGEPVLTYPPLAVCAGVKAGLFAGMFYVPDRRDDSVFKLTDEGYCCAVR